MKRGEFSMASARQHEVDAGAGQGITRVARRAVGGEAVDDETSHDCRSYAMTSCNQRCTTARVTPPTCSRTNGWS